MGKYSVIVFDLGNVLISFDYAPFIGKLNEIRPNLGDELYKRYRENYHIHRSFEAGLMSENQFLDTMSEWTGGAVEKEYFCRIFSEIFTEIKEMTSLLPKLKEKYKLVLLSNTNSIHKKYGYEHYPFLKYFDKLCLSHEIGAVKPEEKIYSAVTGFTQLPPEEHIFIDDIKEYAEGAKKAGWDAVHFTGYENLIKEFEERGII